MKKKIGNFDLVSYDPINSEHFNLKLELRNDPNFKKYFGEFFLKNIDDIFAPSNDLEVGKAYVVLEKNQVIGMIRIFSCHSAGYMEIQYAIRPILRNQGYGSKVLKELTQYFLDNEMVCISLDIDKNNVASIKCALNNGYAFEDNKYRKRR